MSRTDAAINPDTDLVIWLGARKECSLPSQPVRNFIGLSSFEMLAMFRRGLFYAYLSIYLRHYLGMSVTETTLFATLPMLMNIVAQTFLWGRLSDHFQLRRSLIIAGELLAGMGTLAVWYAHRSFSTPAAAGYAIIFGLTAIEIVWSASNIAWSALVSDIYTAAERSGIQGRLSSMGGVGRMFGVWIGGLLYDGLGKQFPGWGFHEGALFFVSTAVMFISTMPLFFLPEGGARPRGRTEDDACAQAPTPTAATGIYLLFLLSMVFINFGRNSIAIVFPQYLALENELAVSSRLLSNIINTQSLAIVIIGLLTGRITRTLGDEKTMICGTVSAIVALLALSCATALPLLFVSSFLRGAADVLVMAPAYTYASVLIPPQIRAQRLAWFNATFFLSWGLAGTLIAGPLVDSLSSAGHPPGQAYQMSFAAAAFITLTGLILLIGLIVYREKSRQRQA